MSAATRMWIIATALASVAIIALGWFLGISPQLAATATANEDRAAVTAQNDAATARIAALKTRFDGIAQTQATLDALRIALPEGAEYADLVDELDGFARHRHVDIIQYRADEPILPLELQSTMTETASSGTPTPLPAGIAVDGLVAIPLTLTLHGDFDDITAFVGDVESGTRLFFVASAKVSDNDTTGEDSQLSGYAYSVTAAGAGDASAGADDTAAAPATGGDVAEPDSGDAVQ